MLNSPYHTILPYVFSLMQRQITIPAIIRQRIPAGYLMLIPIPVTITDSHSHPVFPLSRYSWANSAKSRTKKVSTISGVA